MRLFLKHLWRDLVKFPAQSLLILLTLTLSTSVAVSAFGSFAMLKEHVDNTSGLEASLGDLTVVPSGNDTRIIFERDTKAAVGNDGKVLGEFALSAFLGEGDNERLVSISATDLDAADEFFGLRYVAYDRFTAQNIESAAIISESAAARLSLKLGDTVSLSLLGRQKEYTVRAIACDDGLLNSSDMLVSIVGIKNILAEEIPIISAMGEELLPYTRLIVRLESTADAKACAARIEDATVACRAKITAGISHVNFMKLIELGSVSLLASVVVILAATLTVSSLVLLHEKRRREYAMFALAGADRSTINALKFAESGIYAIIGAIFGILLSMPMLATVGLFFDWHAEPLKLTLSDVIFGAVFAPLLTSVCTAVAIKRSAKNLLSGDLEIGKHREQKKHRVSAMLTGSVLASIAVVALIAAFLIPVAYRFIPAFISLPTLLASLYILLPLLQSKLGASCANMLSRKKRNYGQAILAARSFENVYPLKQITRLMALLVSLIIAIFVCRGAIVSVTGTMKNAVKAELAAVNVSRHAYSKLVENDAVDSIAKIGFCTANEHSRGYVLTVLSISGDVKYCIAEEILPQKIPARNQAVISDGAATLLGITVGDTLSVDIDGVNHNFVISEICKNGLNAIIVNENAVQVKNSMYAVNLKEGADEKQVRRDLLQELEIYGASVCDTDVIFGTTLATSDGFVDLATSTVIISVITVLVGFFDTLVRYYKERSRERTVLLSSGMTVARFVRSSVTEILLSFLLSLAVAIPLGFAAAGILHLAAGSFGFSLFGLI